MPEERILREYGGCKYQVYSSDNEWWWFVMLSDDSSKSQLKTTKVYSPRGYLTQEEAIKSVEQYMKIEQSEKEN